MKLIILIFILAVAFLIFNRSRASKSSHKWRIKSSHKVLKKLKSFEVPGQIFSYLRKVDPFVVEEVILNALDIRKDIKVIRNKKYTGDGGIDGRFICAYWKEWKRCI